MKKLLLAALTALTINTVTAVAGERTAQGNDIYNPNNYRVEYDAESQLTLLIPDYFIPVYKDELKTLEKCMPMYFHDKLISPCIYRYYYYDDNNNKVYIEADTDIYDINGNYYISIREEEDK